MPAAIGNILLGVEYVEHSTADILYHLMKDEKWFYIDFMRGFPQGYAPKPLAMRVSGQATGGL
jgi:hypothetical protein